MDAIRFFIGLFLVSVGLLVLYFTVAPPCVEGYIFSNTTPRVTSSEMLSNAKTGDLILLSGSTSSEKLIRAITRSPYSHVSMVVIENNTAYLWESDIGQHIKSGVRVIPLAEKLALYKGEKTGLWLKFKDESRRPRREDIIPLLNKYIDTKMPKNMDYYLFSSSPDGYFYKESKEDDAMYCSELVAQSLQDLKLLNTEHVPGWYAPKTFLTMKDLYHDPRLFDFKDVSYTNK